MAAKNRFLVDIFDFGTPRTSCLEGVDALLAKGIRIQQLGEFGAEAHKNDSSTDTQPFLWS